MLSGLEMNVSTYSCGDTSFGCSCGDCPSSLACSYPEPSPPKKEYCSLNIGFFEVGVGFIHIHSVVCPLQNRIIMYYIFKIIISFCNIQIYQKNLVLLFSDGAFSFIFGSVYLP